MHPFLGTERLEGAGTPERMACPVELVGMTRAVGDCTGQVNQSLCVRRTVRIHSVIAVWRWTGQIAQTGRRDVVARLVVPAMARSGEPARAPYEDFRSRWGLVPESSVILGECWEGVAGGVVALSSLRGRGHRWISQRNRPEGVRDGVRDATRNRCEDPLERTSS